MARKSTPGGTPATKVLHQAGVPFTVHSYEHDPGTTTFGTEAADELGVDPHRIFKTLVCTIDARPPFAVAVVPVSGQLDLKAFASALGIKKAAMAEPTAAARATGYVVGGISPLGQRTALPTVIDASAQSFATIFVSAGKRGLQIELSPADLCSLSGASFAAVGT